MKRKDKSRNLEDQYQEIIKGAPQAPEEVDSSLEQPYFGRIVQTVTTYSVYGKPDLDLE